MAVRATAFYIYIYIYILSFNSTGNARIT